MRTLKFPLKKNTWQNGQIENKVQIWIQLFCNFYFFLKSFQLDYISLVIISVWNRNRDQNSINRPALPVHQSC